MNLTGLIDSISYRPGWQLLLEVTGGELYLCVSTTGYDAYNQAGGQDYHTSHRLKVPKVLHPHTPEAWQHWVFDCLMQVEKHEAMELFQIGDVHPYAPVHSRSAGRYYDLPDEV